LIFVTVGTHEQQFNRLIEAIDKLKKDRLINEDVFIQSGYSDYIPKYCEWKQMLSYEDMNEYMMKSRIVITHGGPGSIFQCINYGKVPVVVPRNPDYNEHVDKHQIKFVRKLNDKKSVIGIENIDDLENILNNYDDIIKGIGSHSESNVDGFNNKLSALIKDIICR